MSPLVGAGKSWMSPVLDQIEAVSGSSGVPVWGWRCSSSDMEVLAAGGR